MKSEYEILKEESQVIGKWKIVSTLKGWKYNETLYIIEIYQRDNDYFEVMKTKGETIKRLYKEGDKYHLKNKNEEYYIIQSNGNIKSYDSSGYISEGNDSKYVIIN